MKISKAVALPLLLVILLGAMGLSYAWWNETLVIDPTVNTGELKMEFKYPYSDDGPGMKDAKEYEYGSAIRGDWDVGETTIMVVDPYTTKVTLSNVYPGYQARIKLGIYNTGTIPAKIQSVTLTNIVDTDGVLDYVKVGGWVQVQWGPTSYHVFSLASGYPPKWGCPLKDFDDVLLSALKSTQTQPLQTGWKVYFASEDPEEGDSLGFYILDGAPEGASLSFDIEFMWTQFNAIP